MGATGNIVVNNTIHQATVSRWALNIQNASTDNTLLNNIIVSEHPLRGAINISTDSLPNFLSDYNAVISRFTTNDAGTIQTLAQWQASTGQDAHSFVAAPAQLFENWTAGDYRLRSGSPAINTGTATNAPTVDIAGTPRPPGGGFDIGAYEVASTGGVAGDFTGDGFVDGADLAAWKEAFAVSDRGDANGDDVSDGADFLIWQRAFNGGTPTAASVPEPVSCSLLLMSLAGTVAWRRR